MHFLKRLLRPKICALAILLPFVVWQTNLQAATAATAIDLSCSTATDGDGETITCQLFAPDGSQLDDITLRDGDGGNISSSTTRFDWTRDAAAYYFVVQTAEYTTSELRRIGDFIERAAFPVGKRLTGVATVDSALTERAALGAFGRQIQDTAAAIASSPAGTPGSEIADVLAKPIEALKEAEAERKALVLVTDGATGMNDARRAEIEQLARDNRITIINVVVSGSARARSPSLGDLAEATGGSTHDLSARSIEKVLSFASDIPKYLENGARITIDAAGLDSPVELQAEAKLENGSVVTSNTVTVERLTDDGAIDRWIRSIKDNLLAILAGLAVLAGVFLVLRSMVHARRTDLATAPTQGTAAASGYDGPASGPPSGPDEGKTEIIFRPTSGVSGRKPVAFFEVVGTGTEPIPLRPGAVRIGRHAENEICLKNNSVHRKHAVADVAEGGAVTIRDLETQNGVIVNGVRIPSHDLQDGDLVELGEVRLRFIANKDAV